MASQKDDGHHHRGTIFTEEAAKAGAVKSAHHPVVSSLCHFPVALSMIREEANILLHPLDSSSLHVSEVNSFARLI